MLSNLWFAISYWTTCTNAAYRGTSVTATPEQYQIPLFFRDKVAEVQEILE